jgi:hypothetical protein
LLLPRVANRGNENPQFLHFRTPAAKHSLKRLAKLETPSHQLSVANFSIESKHHGNEYKDADGNADGNAMLPEAKKDYIRGIIESGESINWRR